MAFIELSLAASAVEHNPERPDRQSATSHRNAAAPVLSRDALDKPRGGFEWNLMN
jgi:hypothetical protein